MPQAMGEKLAVAGFGNDIARCLVDVAEARAGMHRCAARFVCAAHQLVHLALLGGRLAPEERARHVRAVLVLAASHVEQHDVAGFQLRVVGHMVRVGRVRAEAHNRVERVSRSAQLAVDSLELVGDFPLGRALVHELAKTCHGLVICCRCRAHELLLLVAFDGACAIDGGRAQGEGLRRMRFHQRHEEAGGEVLVDAAGLLRAQHLRNLGKRVVHIVEGEHFAGKRFWCCEQAVQKEDGRFPLDNRKRQETLARFYVSAGEILDGTRVAHDHLREAHLAEAAANRFYALFVHGGPFSCCAATGRRRSELSQRANRGACDAWAAVFAPCALRRAD